MSSENFSKIPPEVLDLADDLIEYANTGFIENARDLSPLFTQSTGTIYRGLYLPKEWLVPGEIIEEWSGSTHWTKSKAIAKIFSTSIEGEDFMYEYGENLGLSNLSEIYPLFEPVILVMDKPVRSIDLGTYLDFLETLGYDVGSHFLSGKNDEQEVSVVGYNFIIEEVQRISGQCYVSVLPVDLTLEVSQVHTFSVSGSLDDKIASASARTGDGLKTGPKVKEFEPDR